MVTGASRIAARFLPIAPPCLRPDSRRNKSITITTPAATPNVLFRHKSAGEGTGVVPALPFLPFEAFCAPPDDLPATLFDPLEGDRATIAVVLDLSEDKAFTTVAGCPPSPTFLPALCEISSSTLTNACFFSAVKNVVDLTNSSEAHVALAVEEAVSSDDKDELGRRMWKAYNSAMLAHSGADDATTSAGVV